MSLQMTMIMYHPLGNVILSIRTRTRILHRNIDAWLIDMDGMKAPQGLLTAPLSHLSNTTLRIQLKSKHVILSLWQAEHLLALSSQHSSKTKFRVMKRPVFPRVLWTMHLP
jgi:hypothetical protein